MEIKKIKIIAAKISCSILLIGIFSAFQNKLDSNKKEGFYFGDDYSLRTDLPIKFAKNDDVLLKLSYPALDSLASFLKRNPNYDLIRIESHVKSGISKTSAQQLTESRAVKIGKYLVQNKGIKCQRLMVIGYGYNHIGEENIISDTIRFKVLTSNAKVIYQGNFLWGGIPTGKHCQK